MADEKDYEKLESRYNSTYAELVDVKKRLEKFASVDIEELKAARDENRVLKSQLDEASRKDAIGDETKIKDYLAKKAEELDRTYGSKFDELNKQLAATQKKLGRFEVVTPALKKAGEKFIPKALPLVEREVEANIRLVDGELVAVDQDGKARRSSKDPRVAMGLDEFLDGLGEQYDFMLAPKTTTGGMSGGERRAAASSNGGGYTLTDLQGKTQEQLEKLSFEDLKAAVDRM